MELWTAVGYRFPADRLVRGVAIARLSAIYAGPRRGFLVGSRAAITCLRRYASTQQWRIADRDFSVVGAGLLFCLSLWLTKSLYWAVGLHAGWDWSQSYL